VLCGSAMSSSATAEVVEDMYGRIADKFLDDDKP
jgi:hypothetical protein